MNLSKIDVRFGNSTIYKWLWAEFEICYSSVVFEEISRHRNQIEGRKNFQSYVRPGHFSDCEKRFFGHALTRMVENKRCLQCHQIVVRPESFTPDLDSDDDRGERHNCCVALDAFKTSHQQVIFLTDDFKAMKDYVNQLFDTIPMGVIWTSLDFVVYLFARYRNRISLDETINVLRSINAQNNQDSSKATTRLTKYLERVAKIDRIIS